MKNFIKELQRRNVIKSALAYLVVAWLLTQVLAIVIPTFELPSTYLQNLIIFLFAGFPVWVVFSWTYEITPEGLKKTKSVRPEDSISGKTSNRLNYIIIAGLVIAISLLIRNSIYTTTATAEVNEEIVEPTTGKSIAVLAFADMSPERDQEYFSDGISEEILNLLVKIPTLKVISRTSSFSFKDKNLDIKEIGKRLNVNHILEGSIRKSGNTFRITAQLIDVKTGAHIWSETYNRDMEDIFKIQDEIAAKVTEQLEVSLMGTNLNSKKINPEAYNLFLQANQLGFQATSEANTNAIRLVKESIAIDSTYAPAWAFLGDLYYNAGMSYTTMPIIEGLKQGRAAAERAITLDPNYSKGYLSLASFEMADWNFNTANKLVAEAARIESNNPRLISTKSDFELSFGKPEKAIPMRKQLSELDPLSIINYFRLGYLYWTNGELVKAEENLIRFLSYNPSAVSANFVMCQVQLGLNRPNKALEYIEKENHPFWYLYGKSMAVYTSGNRQDADILLNQFIADWGDSSWPNIAHVFAFRGEKDNAFTWLELAFEHKDISLLDILNYPAMKNLWGDPRWNTFIQKLGLPEDHGFHLD